MDREFKTTFIPKKNLSRVKAPESKSAQVQRSIISILALLLFITAVVSVVGVYLYKIQLARGVNSRIESINRAEKAFEPAVILELKKLDIRLKAGTELLDSHIMISDFLESLAESTLPEVSFGGLSFTFDEEDPSVSMSGEARGYLPIAQQSDVFQDNQYIQNHIFSDFSLTDTGNISFSLQFGLNRELLNFGRTVENDQGENILTPSNAIINDDDAIIPTGVDIDFDAISQEFEINN